MGGVVLVMTATTAAAVRTDAADGTSWGQSSSSSSSRTRIPTSRNATPLPLFVTAEGPVLTLTLKDDDERETVAAADAADDDDTNNRDDDHRQFISSWRPSLFYSIKSNRQRLPFPNRFPAVKSIQAAFGYRQTHSHRYYQQTQPLFPPASLWMEGVAKLDVGGGVQLQVQPTAMFQVESPTTPTKPSSSSSSSFVGWPSVTARNMIKSILVQAVYGSNYALVRFSSSLSSTDEDDTPINHNRKMMTMMMIPNAVSEIKGSYYYNRIPSASISSVRITPSWNRGSGMNLRLEAVAGGAGRTKLILNYGTAASSLDGLSRRNKSSGTSVPQPCCSLAVQYQPDENHLIRPEINLSNGKMMYQYIAKLSPSSSSSPGACFTATVDPMQAIEMTWIDPGLWGSWITDMTVPLSHPSQMVPHIRIRRVIQWGKR